MRLALTFWIVANFSIGALAYWHLAGREQWAPVAEVWAPIFQHIGDL